MSEDNKPVNWVAIILSIVSSLMCAGVIGGIFMYGRMSALEQRLNDQSTSKEIQDVRASADASEKRILDRMLELGKELKELGKEIRDDERDFRDLKATIAQFRYYPYNAAPAPAPAKGQPKPP